MGRKCLHNVTGFITGLLLLASVISGAGSELDLTLSVEGSAGHDSNRYRTPLETGASYVAGLGAIELAWFVSDASELGAEILYRRAEFTSGSVGFADSVSGQVSWRRLGSAVDGALVLGAGSYRDEALPLDDQAWISLTPVLGYTASSSLQYVLEGSVSYGLYDSATTADGAKQDGTRWDLRPSVVWPLSVPCSLWLRGYAEGYASNNDSEDYTGYGVVTGVSCRPVNRLLTRFSVQWGRRDYPNDYGDVIVDREDHPTFVNGYASYRLASWAECFFTGQWSAYASSEDSLDYQKWTVQGGIRIIRDMPIYVR